MKTEQEVHDRLISFTSELKGTDKSEGEKIQALTVAIRELEWVLQDINE